MTIAELIELLGGYPPELRVVVDSYEEGYDDLSPNQMIVQKICLNTGTESWQGMHGDPKILPGKVLDTAGAVDALVLRRTSW